MKNNIDNPGRRIFIKTVASSAAFVLSFSIMDDAKSSNDKSQCDFTPNGWLKITPDNNIIITVNESEMGQGVMTALPILIAEELDADWETITTRRAELNQEFGYQLTGGSTSVRHAYEKLRHVGAVARQMLVSAAAIKWAVPEHECETDKNYVTHPNSNRKISYGDLVNIACKLPVPETAFLKEPGQFNLIGKNIIRTDLADKCSGKTLFGIDTRIPEMLYATTLHCPVLGATIKAYDDSTAKSVTGVERIFKLDNKTIAVVANNTWSAFEAAKKITIQWNATEYESLTSKKIEQASLKNLDSNDFQDAKITGEPDSHNKNQNLYTSIYHTPLQAHATMEPVCCTVKINDDGCEIWAPSQAPSLMQAKAAELLFSKTSLFIQKLKRKIFGGTLDNIKVHTTYLGGGFGRKLQFDFIAEAIKIAQKINNPVHLTWSREEDIQHDFYRPYSTHKLSAGIINGKINTLTHKIVGIGVDAAGATDIPYQIPNLAVRTKRLNYPIPTGPWRSVGHSYNAYAQEIFIDEVAEHIGQDPVQLRLDLLTNESRLKNTLHLAKQYSDMETRKKSNRHTGFAVHKSFGSYVTQAVVLQLIGNELTIDKIICVIDCGIRINPDTIKAQMEGSIIFALTAVLKSQITINNGQVRESNFHDFPILRFNETPNIDVHIVENAEFPGGVGEPGVPPLAPALTNAIAKATGKRLRTLPIKNVVITL